jgi:hypothetical protein
MGLERGPDLLCKLRVFFEQSPLDLGQDALLVLGQGHMEGSARTC